MTDPALQPGAVVAGRFRVERVLGSGGMADVYACTDLAGGRPIALKLLRGDISRREEAVRRLRREGEVLSGLRHPAIVSIETFGETGDGRIFVAMELLPGETFGALMRRRKKLEPAELAPVIAGVCAGLTAAHGQGIVHRDLKPDNIFLVETPSGVQVKLLDFGISKIQGRDRLTATGEVLGTPRYMAPEQLTADPEVDARVDVYALGVMLYEALAGSPPFLAPFPSELLVAILHGKAAPIRSLRPDLSGDLEAVVMRAMARAKEARFASAAELCDAFLDAAGSGRASIPSPVRAGMSTAVLGSMDAADAPNATGTQLGASGAGDSMRPGTFAAIAMTPPRAVAAPVIGAPGQPDAALAATAPMTPGAKEAARASAVPAPPSSGAQPLEPPPALPTRDYRWLLWGGAGLLGALSAGLAIMILSAWNGDRPGTSSRPGNPAVGAIATPPNGGGPSPADAGAGRSQR